MHSNGNLGNLGLAKIIVRKKAEVNPKDEVEKLIQSELKKWVDYDSKNKNFHINQIDNFRPFRALLNDLVASIEPEYVKASILDDHAMIEISNEIDSSSRISWHIQPNFKKQEDKEEYWDTNLWQNKVNVEAVAGFKVQTKRGNDREKNSEFGTENELISHLAQEIARRVAYYRYRKAV